MSTAGLLICSLVFTQSLEVIIICGVDFEQCGFDDIMKLLLLG